MSKITKQRSQKSKNRTLKHLKNKNESTKKKKMLETLINKLQP